MADISLFVCCHQPVKVPSHSLLKPIQVGVKLSDERFENFLYDDEGDNISEKNRIYCELTAQYWAWKNFSADYYGFFHYRRFLYPDIYAKRSYRIEGEPTQKLLNKLKFDDFSKLIEGYDLISPISEDMHISVREHYANAPFHHKKDLDLIEQIIAEKYPKMKNASDTYLSQSKCYFGNIYIMSKPVFFDYCSWLFSILEEFDLRCDISNYSAQEKRVDGYLAERLFGIYLTYLKDISDLKITELPRVHFVSDKSSRIKQRVINSLFPPGSCFRKKIKKLIKGR